MKLEQLREVVLNSCQISTDRPLLVGVSGGPDSLCLLDGLALLQIPLVVAHFDHQLRPEAQADATFVEAVAGQLGLPFVLGRHDVAAYAGDQRLSLEEAARILRYRFLFEQARARAAQAVAVGHTADDQVETVLMHLLRGTGLSGLTGMSPRSFLHAWDAEIPLVRPLLSFWREEILDYCRERDLHPVQDASNQNPAFLRNRLRHELIPLLEGYNPNFRQALWRMARVLEGDEEIIQPAVEKAWAGCLASQGKEIVELNYAGLKDLPTGLLRAILRKAIQQLLPTLSEVNFAAIKRIEHFLVFPSPGRIDLVQGTCAFIERGCLVISRSSALPPKEDWPQMVPGSVLSPRFPGRIDLPSGWQLVSQWIEQPDFPDLALYPFERAWEAWLDADVLPEKIVLRCPKPGDRFQPLGLDGHTQKLSDFWINVKLPRRARAAWPILASADRILWIPGYRIAHSCRLKKDSRRALYLRLLRES